MKSLPTIRPAWYKKIWSYILGWKEADITSAHSGLLELWWMDGRLVLNTAHANYSYDTLHRAFREGLATSGAEKNAVKNVLLLGMGGGSVIDILHREWKWKCHITAVEIDRVMIAVAEKYFGIKNGPLLDIIHMDAAEFVLSPPVKYDLAAMDIFIDEIIPEKFTEKEFILQMKSCVAPEGILLCNCMSVKDAGKLMEYLPGSSSCKVRTGNTMVVWKNKTGNG